MARLFARAQMGVTFPADSGLRGLLSNSGTAGREGVGGIVRWHWLTEAGGAMMGRRALAGKLFYQVSLEEPVPAGHLLRSVAGAVDFGVARRLTARFYSHTGQS